MSQSISQSRSVLRATAFTCTLLALALLGSVGLVQAQQPDPLTITKEGNVGIGTTAPANKLSVAGNADVSGNVGIGMTDAGPNRLKISSRVGGDDPSALQHQFQLELRNGIGNRALAIGLLDGGQGVLQVKEVNVGSGYKDLLLNPVAGNVGIGTTTPANKLSVAGGADVSGNLGLGTLSVSGKANFSGNVGIGTAPSTRAKLEVLGSGAVSATFGQVTLLRNNDSTTVRIPWDANPTSIYADQGVAASSFWAFSDERLKRIQGRSNAARDLATLMDIEITDYSFVDSVSKGTRMQKKVTGQQVEKVFPQAVTRNTDVVPDIYLKASVKDGWVILATNLKKGERVRLIGEKQEGIHEVLEVAEGRFRTAFAADGDQVFVYGREVSDARSVDYEAISMLNVSATQQIKKEKDEEVKALQEENAALRSQLAEQEKRLAELEAKDKTRDEKLAAIETLLLSREETATRNGSPKKVN